MTPYSVNKLDKKYQVGLTHPDTDEPLVWVMDFFEEHRAQPVYSQPTAVIGGVLVPVGERKLVGAAPEPSVIEAEFATKDKKRRVRGRWNGSWYWTGVSAEG